MNIKSPLEQLSLHFYKGDLLTLVTIDADSTGGVH